MVHSWRIRPLPLMRTIVSEEVIRDGGGADRHHTSAGRVRGRGAGRCRGRRRPRRGPEGCVWGRTCSRALHRGAFRPVDGVVADGHAHHLREDHPLSARTLAAYVEHDALEVCVDAAGRGFPYAQATRALIWILTVPSWSPGSRWRPRSPAGRVSVERCLRCRSSCSTFSASPTVPSTARLRLSRCGPSIRCRIAIT